MDGWVTLGKRKDGSYWDTGRNGHRVNKLVTGPKTPYRTNGQKFVPLEMTYKRNEYEFSTVRTDILVSWKRILPLFLVLFLREDLRVVWLVLLYTLLPLTDTCIPFYFLSQSKTILCFNRKNGWTLHPNFIPLERRTCNESRCHWYWVIDFNSFKMNKNQWIQ